MFPIIDAHCHIYPDKIAEKAVASIGEFYDIPMVYDGRLETLKTVSKAAGVSLSMIFSVATTPHQVNSINNFIAENVRLGDGCFMGLGALHPDSEDMEEDIGQIISLGLKGVKLHPDVQQVALDDKRCLKIFELCEGRLPVLLHCGDERYDYSNPNRLKRVLETFPGLQVIGAHFGGYSVWQQAARELSGYDNLVVDCSSSFPFLPPEEAKRIISVYGADRVLFASDFPMWNPRENIDYLLGLGLSDDDLEKIFYKNAERIFDIKL